MVREAQVIAFEVRGVIARRYGFETVEPPEPMPEIRVHEVITPPSSFEVQRWIAALDRADAGEGERGVEAACEAAVRLSELRELPPRALRGLEEVVTIPGRSPRLQMAAVDALGWAGGDAAERALARMRAVVRRRLGWEPGPADKLILQHIEARLRSMRQRLGQGISSAA
jgi:hypothetical protein